ncbi:MAG: branched-chain amino acid ABC transporter substrate-binding protein [bacterium]|nr:branched-chain amino acid ABC transporter substrate-binding protein [bacterium]
MRRFFLLALFLIVLFWISSGCKGGSHIVIGYAAPMTGESAKMGDDISKGVLLAVEEWNTKGGIHGKKIRVEGYDDRADPKEAVSVAQRAISQGVRGVIGHYNSSCTIPASNLYDEAGVIMITPASTNPQVTSRGLKHIFRVCGRDDQQGKTMADALQPLGKIKVAILHDKTTYGQGLADEFRKHLSSDIQVVLYEAIQRGDKDFSAVLTKVKSVQPNVVMFGGLYPEGGLITKQMRDLGISSIFLSGDGTYDPEYIRIAGKAAEGAWLTYAPPADEIPTAKEFLKNYQAKYGEVGPYSLFAYDAANILLGAIAKKVDASGLELANIIRSTQWQAAMGTIEFTEQGDPKQAPYVMWTVENGKLVVKK